MMEDMNDIIYRLRERARIRRQIPTRKSVQEGKPDRISDLLEEAAAALIAYRDLVPVGVVCTTLNPPFKAGSLADQSLEIGTELFTHKDLML